VILVGRTINGYLLDVDYLINDGVGTIRITVRGDDRAYEVFDPSFYPYFYLQPDPGTNEKMILDINGIKVRDIVSTKKSIFGKESELFKIILYNPMDVPSASRNLSRYGTTYESDIPFAKRYLIDKGISPLGRYSFDVEDNDGRIILKEFAKSSGIEIGSEKINVLCFDIETYNPLGWSRPTKDPVVMLSYSYRSVGGVGSGVITFKRIDRDFVTCVADEKELFAHFTRLLDELDIDIVSGYNSANFDIRYMIDRASALGIDFNISRFKGETKIERHGLVDKVKIAGRVHVDMYVAVKFISIVGAAESILKLNSYTLKNVYEAVSRDKKLMVDKPGIYKLWDGTKAELEVLADYNLNDSHALHTVYDAFMPIMVEITKISGNSLSDICVSTSGQIVEFLLMRYSVMFGELIPNKPSEVQIRKRLSEPIEGAYVKTPEPGIYEKLAIFDFRSLYPSIIISHNIDPSSLCTDCKDYYESPLGYKFSKDRKSITPTILRIMLDARAEVKKMYKKDKDNIALGARSQALKIIANSFYGYLGYARSRWYSRECASSTTAYGRQYIQDTISSTERAGFKVIYGDTDSIVMLLNEKSREDAIRFVGEFNEGLPESMNLELEDFYKRGIFVGKKTEQSVTGAKKKYALISYDGYIKIRGFELVRRDWSRVARETQKRVLEAILMDGNKEMAVGIVKEMIMKLRSGEMPIEDLSIRTQLRKGIDSYDTKSPEVMAVRTAIEKGLKSRSDLENSVISYVITKHGSTISEKAMLTEFAKDYDAEYYINNQLIPATMRILKEIGFNEDEVKGLGKQQRL
jgi:DNA polymerase (pol2)